MARPRFSGWFFLGLPILLVVGALIFLGQAGAFLKSDRFRTFLGGKISETIHAHGRFQTLEWNGTSFYSENFAALGNTGAALENLEAQQLRGMIDLGGLWERKWLIEDVELERLLIVPAGKQKAEQEVVATPKEKKTAAPSGHFFSAWLPNRVEVSRATVANLKLDGKNLETPFVLDGVKVIAKPDGGAWLLEATGGHLQLAGAPQLTLGDASIRYSESVIFINRANWLVADGGTVAVNGEIPQKRSGRTSLIVKVDRVPAAQVLPKDWRARLLGQISADLQVEAQDGDWKATGPVTLTEGRLEALPVLEQVALFTRTQRFRQLNLEKVSADLTVEKHRITAANLTAESPGLVRIRGSFVVENDTLKGDFVVGLTPASLRYIPGSQGKVFSAERDGFLWTTMKVSGPLGHLHEDLSERLAVAAGEELIDTLQKNPSKLKDTLKDAAQSLLDMLGK